MLILKIVRLSQNISLYDQEVGQWKNVYVGII